jgi:hypothetical protein
MPESPKRSSASTSPFKLALAAALAVIFVVVLVVQFGGASGTERMGKQRETGENKVQTPRRTVAPNDGPQSQGLRRRRHTASRWPVLQTADMLEHDPFAVPAAFLDRQDSTATRSGPRTPDAARGQRAELMQRQAERDRVLDSLKQEGVKLVIGSSTRKSSTWVMCSRDFES